MSTSTFMCGTTATAGADVTTVNLTNNGVSVFDPNSATAGFRFNSDGTVDRQQLGSYVQVNASTDWIIPNEEASADYEIFATHDALSSGTVLGDVLDTWLSLGSNREWYVACTGNDVSDVDLVISIRFDGGPVLTSANFSMIAECN